MSHPALTKAIEKVGLADLARGLGVTYQAVRKWESAGRLPRTEWTGETDYARRIVELSGGAVTRDELLRLPREHQTADEPPAPEPAERAA